MSELSWTRSGQTTMIEVLESAIAKWPDRPAFEIGGQVISRTQLDLESGRLANGLAALDVKEGDRVCVMLDNCLDFVLLMFAITRMGAVIVPLNTSLKGEFLRHQITDSEAQVIIAESDYAERVLAIAEKLPAARLLLHRGPAPTGDSRLSVRPLDDARAPDGATPKVAIRPDDLAMLMYTSGTTGPSKGCMVSHNYICNLGRLAREGFEQTESDVVWTPLPLFHINAIGCAVLAPLSAGAKSAFTQRFSLSNFWPEIERTGATTISLIGSMIALIAAAADSDAAKRCYGQIRSVVGVPFPEQTKEIWRKRFGITHAGAPGYGMTEMCMITFERMSVPVPPNASGRLFEDYDVRIFDDNGFECPRGVPGEIVARPNKPNIMFQGYWRQPVATAAAWTDLWFHTGDIGTVDADGYFTFLDRKKDYLRRGGENISSYEMETEFREHPAIDDIAVHAVKSELTEDEVKVTATLKPGATISEEELCRWAVDRLPYFAVPRYIEFRSDLPRNPVGRVLKNELRDQGVTPATWDRAKSDIKLVKR